jgi:hypothetical protein
MHFFIDHQTDVPHIAQHRVSEGEVEEILVNPADPETVYGVTSHTRDTADSAGVLGFNRGH